MTGIKTREKFWEGNEVGKTCPREVSSTVYELPSAAIHY